MIKFQHLISKWEEFTNYHVTCTINGIFVGYGRLTIFTDDDPKAVMSDINVHKDHCKKGIGKKLQEYRENIAMELKFKKIFLFVDENTWIHQWYTRRGFTYHAKKSKTEVWLVKNLKWDGITIAAKKKLKEAKVKCISNYCTNSAGTLWESLWKYERGKFMQKILCPGLSDWTTFDSERKALGFMTNELDSIKKNSEEE